MSFDVKQEETVSCRCLKMKNHHSVVVEYYSGFISFQYSSVLNRSLFFLFFSFCCFFLFHVSSVISPFEEEDCSCRPIRGSISRGVHAFMRL